jgi:hypothetical protein
MVRQFPPALRVRCVLGRKDHPTAVLGLAERPAETVRLDVDVGQSIASAIVHLQPGLPCVVGVQQEPVVPRDPPALVVGKDHGAQRALPGFLDLEGGRNFELLGCLLGLELLLLLFLR